MILPFADPEKEHGKYAKSCKVCYPPPAPAPIPTIAQQAARQEIEMRRIQAMRELERYSILGMR